jgi:3,4-dihydroxy 2-butanone 4-phosphate synthase/GTP cyclohydrolase II
VTVRTVVEADGPRAAASSPFDRVEDAIAAIARGEIVVVVDDDDRESEGDLIVAADAVTTEKVAFLVNHTSGVICVGLESERCDALRLPLMVPLDQTTDRQGKAFTITVDLAAGTATGISAAGRAATILALADPQRTTGDFNRPGHVFPLRACPGGVLERGGHTEAAVDLARLAGRAPAGVLCEVVLRGGDRARIGDLRAFAKRHGLVLISIADLVAHRRRSAQLVRRVAEARMPTGPGVFRCLAFESVIDGETHLAFAMGDVASGDDVLVAVHGECLVGDVFGGRGCDCRENLDQAMRRVAEEGSGVVVYLRGQNGSWIAQCADPQGHVVSGQILRDLGIRRVRLMTDDPERSRGLEDLGLESTEQVPLHLGGRAENVAYLRTERHGAVAPLACPGA